MLLTFLLTTSSHPLQELKVPSYVANDTFLVGGEGTSGHCSGGVDRSPTPSGEASCETDGQPSMLIMTGPNYSGKSVHIKQVALIVYMAHVGCFVPADAATIGLTDKILTRIATKETITRVQSAFMIDLQQVYKTLNLATRRSLVIVDEFGKGTDSYGRRIVSFPGRTIEPLSQMVPVLLVVFSSISLTLMQNDQRCLGRRTFTRSLKMAFSYLVQSWRLGIWKFELTRMLKQRRIKLLIFTSEGINPFLSASPNNHPVFDQAEADQALVLCERPSSAMVLRVPKLMDQAVLLSMESTMRSSNELIGLED